MECSEEQEEEGRVSTFMHSSEIQDIVFCCAMVINNNNIS